MRNGEELDCFVPIAVLIPTRSLLILVLMGRGRFHWKLSTSQLACGGNAGKHPYHQFGPLHGLVHACFPPFKKKKTEAELIGLGSYLA